HCAVTIAENGRLAVEAAERDWPDIVLMDLSMPEMDGVQATSILRNMQQENGRALPIVGVTAHALREDRQRCLDAGMDDYVPKPVKQEALFEVLARCMGRGEKRRLSRSAM
ncbi:MAG: response regulator, partial [Pseudomonadota bacterium]